MTMGLMRCTALIPAKAPDRPGRTCGRAASALIGDDPRCGYHSRGLARASRPPPASGEYALEPKMISCAMRCSCGARAEVLVDGDAPLREVLSALSCPRCGLRGDMKLARKESA